MACKASASKMLTGMPCSHIWMLGSNNSFHGNPPPNCLYANIYPLTSPGTAIDNAPEISKSNMSVIDG